MNAVLNWIKGEPALIAALVGIITTLASTIPAQQGTLGAILAAVQALLAIVVRQSVTPVAKLGRSSH